MCHQPELIVMLTCNDQTVKEAYDIFMQCKSAKAKYWGIKEKPLPLSEMKRIFTAMKACGKTTVLEVVAYTEEEGLQGARLAYECGADILMGTLFSDAINTFCQEHSLKYMPFVGKISGRPSVLRGHVDEMIAQAKGCLEKGVYGIDLLGYRYEGDAAQLNALVIDAIKAPVCLAGSIDCIERLNEVKKVSPWAFTVGSAFFNNKFPGTISEQIDFVCDYMKGEA